MAPTIGGGDLVVVVPEALGEIEVGQVIVYNIPIADRHREIHRVVSVTHGPAGTDVVTRGDANQGPDPWTARLAGGTVWRMSTRIPWLGFLVLFLGRPELRIACLILGTALLFAIGLRWIWSVPSPGRRGIKVFHADP
jgi:signal peptidase